jgi:hypothetical protein
VIVAMMSVSGLSPPFDLNIDQCQAILAPINGDSDDGDEVNDEKDQDSVPFSSVAITLAVKNRTTWILRMVLKMRKYRT